MSLFTCRGLTRRPFFAGKDLDLEAGQVVTLSGPSGSGKTLFLRALADLDPADEGNLVLDGVSRAALTPTAWRSRVLYVHQAGIRLPGTVAENLQRVLRLAATRGRAAPAPEPVPGLDPNADAEQLSGGEAQALAIHRALLCKPDVLLLDESTSAMDPDTAERWEARIRAFAAAGSAVLWVAHDARIADRVADRRERFA